MREYLLNQEALQDFGYLIPGHCRRMLLTGEACGIGFVDDMHENEIIGVILLRAQHGWAELAWLCLDEAYRGAGYAEELLQSCVNRLRRKRRLFGIFADLPDTEPEAYLHSLFEINGFSVMPVEHDCYASSLGEILEKKVLAGRKKEYALTGLKRLSETDEHLRRKLLLTAQETEGILPLPLRPDWERYDGQLSSIHCDSEGIPDAVLLLTPGEGYFTLECAWSNHPTAFLVMLQEAVRLASEKYPKETGVHVPVITQASARLAEKLLGTTEKMSGLQARLLFE